MAQGHADFTTGAPAQADHGATAPASPNRLDLAEDDRLPWLESDDDDEPAGGGGTRLIGFALVGLLVVVAIVGAIWWLGQRSAQGDLVADGSTVAAPAGPYKVRPSDPGGKTYRGTGDQSYKAGEGQEVRGSLAAADVPAPVAAPAPGPGASTAPVTPSANPSAAATTPASAQPSGPGVQIGAYLSRDAAETGWATLLRQYSVLSGVSHRVVEGRADIGTVYRLQATPGDRAAANQLCGALKAAGGACQVKG